MSDTSSLETDSSLIEHRACLSCASSDAMAVYDDGHGFCFSCNTHFAAVDDAAQRVSATVSMEPTGWQRHAEIQPIPNRKLTRETCSKWGYESGPGVHIANYRDESGALIAQKLRRKGKDFTILGDARRMGLYGKWLWGGGKMLVITEGEIDALSVSQSQGNKWPVVSVPNGAQSAAKAVQKDLEYVEKFDSVILMFDMDEHGRKASQECAQLLSPGKAKIATLPLKDANEMLVAGREKELISAIWNAQEWRPDGIVKAEDFLEQVIAFRPRCDAEYPWKGLQEITRGQRLGELVTWCAGTGIGKSQFLREVAYGLLQSGEKVGYVAFEESVVKTVLGFVSLDMGKRLHVDRDEADDEAIREAFQRVCKDRLFLYDHFGSMEPDRLMSRLRYLITGCGCKWIILDHLSIVVSGLDDSDSPEWKLIDRTMTQLRSLSEGTGAGIHLISHLKGTSSGASLEEGAPTHLDLLRGSRSIGQLSDFVIGLERNQQADDRDERNTTTMRVLKSRHLGETGVACRLKYNTETGRLSEAGGGEDY